MEDIKPLMFRGANMFAGFALLLGLKGPSGGNPTTVFIYLIAAPFLVFSIVPGKRIATFLNSVLVGFGCLLAAGLWGYAVLVLIFAVDHSLSALYGTMAAAVTAAIVIDILALKESTSPARGSIPPGILIGLFYLPMAWGIAANQGEQHPANNHYAQPVYHSLACSIQYKEKHTDWATSLKEASALPGCKEVEQGIEYKRTPSGFEISSITSPSYYADQSGIVRTSSSSGPIVHNCANLEYLIVFDLSEFHGKQGDYPSSLDDMPATITFLQSQRASQRCLITYQRKSRAAYSLRMRPAQYGINGIRSYYADQNEVIHATPLDRDATAADPIAPKEELQGF